MLVYLGFETNLESIMIKVKSVRACRDGRGQMAYWLSNLKELSHGILSYFGHTQNCVQIDGNLKITV